MVFRSPFPDVEVPDVTVPSFVLERAAELGSKPAVIDGPTGRTMTYAQLTAGAGSLAAGLIAGGLEPGQVVATFAPNLPEWAVIFHGVALASGVNATVNSLFSADDVAKQLGASHARWLITVEPFLDRALPAAHSAGVDDVFVLGADAPEGTRPFGELLRPPAPGPSLDPSTALVALPQSSGTTGFAKAVKLTHRNLVANVLQAQAPIGIRESDVLIGVLPFFHIYGLTVILNLALWQGATVVSMPKFELDAFLRLLQDRKVTVACIVPPIVLALAKHPAVDAYDLSSLEMVLSGAAPLDGDVAALAAERLGCMVVQGYGLTEASPVVSAPPRDASRQRPAATGLILPSTEIRVQDPATGDELGPKEDGEIQVRGPQVMAGYLDDDEATGRTLDTDGWLHTGDIGHVDEDGWLYVVDRLKELIKYRGFQVPPAELEAILTRHPAVADAAVIPSPDPVAGEVPKAFVVRAGDVDEGDVMSWVNGQVPSFKKIRRIEFIDEIPRSASGKILRRVLVDRERSSR